MAQVILSAAGGGGMSNPMTTSQDLIIAGANGAPARLAMGGPNQVLTVVGGVVQWANASSGFSNPMLSAQDLIIGGTAGSAQRLGVGANNQVLTIVGGVVQWANAASGFSNPMTAADDLIKGGSSGVPQRLAHGIDGQALRVKGTTLTWVGPESYALYPSGDTSGVSDDTAMANAIAALPNGGRICAVANSTTPFYTAVGWSPPVQTVAGISGGGPVCIQGYGRPVLMPVSAGIAAIFYHRTSDYGSPATNQPLAGSIRDIIIDGSLATSGATLVQNLVPNPNFEHDADGSAPASWGSQITTTSTITLWQAQSGWAASGQLSGRLTGTINSTGGAFTKVPATGTSATPVTANSTYQIQAQANVLRVDAGTAVVGVRWYDATGATISTPTMPSTCYTPLAATGTFALSGTITAPANAAFVAVRIGFTSNTGTGTCDGYFDNVMFGPSATVVAYADGDSPGWTWSGTVGNSVSSSMVGAIGLDVGDGDGFDIDVGVCNFQGLGSVGANLFNRLFGTSHSTFKIRAYHNDTNVMIASIGDRFTHCHFDLHLRADQNQQGVVVNSTTVSGGTLGIHGTMQATSATSGTPTNNTAMLSLLSAGKVFGARVEAHIEQNTSGVGAVWPWALYSDGQGVIQECEGYIDTDLNGSAMNGAECSMRGWYALNQVPNWPSVAFPGYGTRWYNKGPDAQVVVTGGTVSSIGLNLVNLGSITSGVFPVKAGGSIKINGSGASPSWTVVPDNIITEGAADNPGVPSGVALFGNSLNAGANAMPGCSGTPLDLCTAAAEDHLLFGSGSSTKMAQQIMKLYLESGNSTTGSGARLPGTAAAVRAVWPNMDAFLAQGGKVLISLKPTAGSSGNATTGDQYAMNFSSGLDAKFTACVAAINAVCGAGNWKATLWQEMNGSRFAGTGQAWPNGPTDYHKYWNHYAPLFKATVSVPLVYDPQVASGGGNNGSAGAVAYCPPATYIDEVACDFYCTSYGSKTSGQRIDAVATMADQMSGGAVPFALAEWALRASPTAPSQTQWNDYISYLVTLFSARRAAGKKFGWMIYYGIGFGDGTPAANGTDNGWSVSTDFKLAGVMQLYNALAV